MIKSIFKEVFIMLLVCVAIVLILGVLLYDYIPNNKVVPSKVAYKTPENVQEEIAVEITEYEKTNIVYEITDSDLNLYKSTKSYNPGKADPFADLSNEVTESTNNTTGGGSTSGNGSGTGTNKNPDSTGSFFEDSGTK